MKDHLPTCGTAYRGCDPKCPKDLAERKSLTEGYVANKGRACPYCDCTQMIGGEVCVSDGVAVQSVCCTECDSTWVDEYKLVNMLEDSESWSQKG